MKTMILLALTMISAAAVGAEDPIAERDEELHANYHTRGRMWTEPVKGDSEICPCNLQEGEVLEKIKAARNRAAEVFGGPAQGGSATPDATSGRQDK